MQTYDRVEVKAAHSYEVADSRAGVTVAGKRYHFIGAGGVGMSGLAQLLIKNKATVTGSDQTQSQATDRLIGIGADIKIGHCSDNLDPKTDTVVISAAIKEDNPELMLAHKRGCEIKKYAQMLGVLSDCYKTIAVAGTHGKSTTSGWLVHCLKQAGFIPNFIVGADITQMGGSCGTAESRYFVAEACEYDRSFLNLKPEIAVILNVEKDHLDYYEDEGQIVDAFGKFALGIRPGGVLIANGEDSNVAEIIRDLHYYTRNRQIWCETFGFAESCNFSARNIQLIDGLYNFDVYHNGKLAGSAKISLPGRHNILNALAVVAVAANIAVPCSEILDILSEFTGIDRRLMLKDRIGQITVVDDYAHHPTEIKASLQAIREKYQPKRIWCVFQPHQHSRTRFLLEDMAKSFNLADVTIVPEIYFVRDSVSMKKEIHSNVLIEKIRDNGTEAVFIDDFRQIGDYLKRNVKPDELVVTMGAGDIWKVADEYIQWLRTNR